MNRTFVIAECASAHDGDLSKAKRLIDAAVVAGADAAKFQFWSSADRLADRRDVPPDYREIYRRYQIPREWLTVLSSYCGGRIEFMATTYLPEDIPVVLPHVHRLKVASFESKDHAFLEAHAATGRQTLVSTGMSDERQWHFAGIVPLHCVSAYPAPIEATNLLVLRQEGLLGLSDHSRAVDMGALAVAAGAWFVEAHVRLDDTSPHNPDFAVAFSPAEFNEYVRLIRRAERIMGDGVKRPQPCEAPMLAYRVKA